MENIKIPFFKRVKRSIVNFESYSDFAVEKMSVAIKYIAKLTLIFSIIVAIVFSYKFSTMVNNEEQLQIMRNQLQETSGLDLATIEQAMEYIKSNNNFTFYATLAISFSIYFFCAIFLYSFIDAAVVSIIGFIASRITRIKLKYTPIYKMSIYALTLPIILNCIYIVVNTFYGFTIDYFQIVYNVIAYIYIVTAVLMIKTDFIEQQQEIIKIVQEQRRVRHEERQKEEDKPEENSGNKEDKKKKEIPPSDDPTTESQT